MTARTIPSRPFQAPQLRTGRSRSDDVPPALRDALWQRSGGLCEACGQSMRGGDAHVHHRKRRSQGGEHSVTNCLLVHGRCHNGIHAHPAPSYDAGFLVRATEQPGRKRLALHFERWVRLTREGTYVEAA